MKMLFLFRRYGGIVGFQDAAFRRADELYDFVAYLALGNCAITISHARL